MNNRLLFLLVAAIAVALLPSCMEPPPGSESSIWERPPRYGHGGTDSPKPKPRNENNSRRGGDAPDSGSGGGRFGYSGDDDEAPVDTDPDVDEAPRDRDRDTVAEEKPAEKPAPEKKSGPPSVAEMPFAKGVPGKPLSVILPAPHSHLGEVSIEQYEGGKPTGKPLPPGTPVEIPDPGSPGKKIYFKVP